MNLFANRSKFCEQEMQQNSLKIGVKKKEETVAV